MPISHDSHPHTLLLKSAKHPYYCQQCNQLGIGFTYTCDNNDCNFFLHKQCGKPEPEVKYPFSSNECKLTFRTGGGSGENSLCVVCSKKIKGCHYRCLCSYVIRNVHPSCLSYEQTLAPLDGITLHLSKVATAKCLHCGKKDLCSKVKGWAYVSSCGEYCYHVSCVMQIVNENWKYGFFAGHSDPFRTIKQRFPEDMNKMQLMASGRKGKSTIKKAKTVLSVLFNTLTGNYFGLVGDAARYFS